MKKRGRRPSALSASEQGLVRFEFLRLVRQDRRPFPPKNAPRGQGVYIISEGDTVLHVGRTLGGKRGLHRRLLDHLRAQSSFTRAFLRGRGWKLRAPAYRYQCVVVPKRRLRALLEAYAVGMLCPRHVGLGKRGTPA